MMRRVSIFLAIIILSNLAIAQPKENSDLTTASAMVFGPTTVYEGDNFEIQIIVTNVISESSPIVKTENEKDIRYENGVAFVTFEANQIVMNLIGNITIQNLDGDTITRKWEHEVYVLKHVGSIESTSPVLYRGIENEIDPIAVGFPVTVLTATGASINIKDGIHYAIPKEGYDSVEFSVFGMKVSGDKVLLRKKFFKVLDLPLPVITLNGKSIGENISSNELTLEAHLSSTSPIEENIEILHWELFTNKKSVEGEGANLKKAQKTIKKLNSGDQFIVMCEIKRSGELIKLYGTWIKQ